MISFKNGTLTLWIESCSCRCGNAWTHSYLTYPNGGTPNPIDEDKFTVTHIIPSRRNYSSCFRCAPLGLGIGWTKETPAQSAVQTPRNASASELLE